MHWHPNADEWQYWIKGNGRMTVFDTGPEAVTLDFNPGDIGYVTRSKGPNSNGGLKWIQKGGGYWSECNKHLKG